MISDRMAKKAGIELAKLMKKAAKTRTPAKLKKRGMIAKK